MFLLRLLIQVSLILSFITISVSSYANEPNISNSGLNYILWIAVVVGVVVGMFFYNYLYKSFKTYERLKSLSVSIIVALFIGLMPLYFGSFASLCMQTITDANGQVREMIVLADQCVVSREEVSAWGISHVVSSFKSALGYNDAGSFLSTGLVRIFYALVLIFWTTIFYFVSLFVWKQVKK